MPRRILVTGSEGLIGTEVVNALVRRGYEVRGFDLRGRIENRGDVRDSDSLKRALRRCNGVIHLAAVSRVVWGEADPGTCLETNVGGTRNLADALLPCDKRPWVVFASSREVYGQATRLPIWEDAPLAPINVYGRSKVEGEAIMASAQEKGVKTAILRFSNVYGRVTDHEDRVVPAFVRQAVRGERLRVDGAENVFDFTHVQDVARGVLASVEILESGKSDLVPVHLVSGIPTTLGALASLAVDISGSKAVVSHVAARTYDVSMFYGDPKRAYEKLGWRTTIGVAEGIRRLMEDYRKFLSVGTVRCQIRPVSGQEIVPRSEWV